MNSVNLIGNVAQAPEYTTFASGKRNARLNLVINTYSGKQDPIYIRCEFWEANAANLEKCNVQKGTKLSVSGALAPNNWEK